MFDSPRPVRTMAARTELRLPTVAALWPLALAALLAVPAQAAHHAAPRIAAHSAGSRSGAAVRPTARAASPARATSAMHAAATGRGIQRASVTGGAHHAATELAQGRSHDRARTPAKIAPNTLALTTLHDRAARYSHAETATRGTSSRTHLASGTQPDPTRSHSTVANSVALADNADTGTADRVHAWYRANTPAASNDSGTTPLQAITNSEKTSLQEARQTTEADDKAAAQSHLPSTAPTEREPAPFTHGSFSDDTTHNPSVPAGHAQATSPMLHDGSAPLPSSRTPVTVAAVVPAVRFTPAPGASNTFSDNRPSSTAPAPSINLFDSQGRLVPIAAMKGSHDILVHQNQMAVADALDRIQNDRDLLSLRQRKLLVALPDETGTYPDDRLPMNRRYARPWTVQFLRDLSRAHHARFGTPLIVTSAARTVEFQRRLVRTNGNAAPPTGDIASPHLYGQAIDIGKRGMGLTELTWMRAYMTPVENDGKIDVEEEFQQSCFHISVYRRYQGLPAPQPVQSAQPLLTAKATPAPEPPKPEKKRRRLTTAMLAVGLR